MRSRESCWKRFIDFLGDYKKQDAIFYLGCLYIILTYLRPQAIYPELNFLPWLKITILAGLGLMIVKGRLKLIGIHYLLLLLSVIGVISAYTSYYPEISKEKMFVPLIWALEVIFLSNTVKNSRQLKLMVLLWFLVLAKMSIFGMKVMIMRGFAFTSWGIQGPPGFFQNSGEYGLLMAMLAVMSIPWVLEQKKCKWILWVLPISAIISVIGSSSRGDQLALTIGLLYLFVSYGKLRLKSIVIGAVVLYALFLILPEKQKERFMSAGDDGTSVTRILYWKAGIDMISNNPLFGVGLFAFPDYYRDYYKANSKIVSSYSYNRQEVSHNSFIQVGTTMGVLALLIYFYFHWYVFLSGKHRKKGEIEMLWMGRSLRLGVVVYLIGAFFMSVAFYPYIYLLISLSITYRNSLKTIDNNKG